MQPSLLFIYLFIYVYLLFRDRGRQSMSRGGAERQEDTECEAGSRLRAVSTEPSPMQGQNSQTARSWPEPKSEAQLTEPPRWPPSATSNLFEEIKYTEVGQNLLTTYQMCKGKRGGREEREREGEGEGEGGREKESVALISYHLFHLALKHSSHRCDGGEHGRETVGKHKT